MTNFVTSWRVCDVMINFLMLWCAFYFMTNSLTSYFLWYDKHFWRHDKLFYFVTCFALFHDKLVMMTPWQILLTSQPTFWPHDKCFWCHNKTFWRHDVLLTSWKKSWQPFLSWRMFLYTEKFLTSQHIFCMVWCCDILFDLMKVTNLRNARTS